MANHRSPISAILMNSKDASTRHSVALRISPTLVSAEGKDASCSFPLKGLVITSGGANNSLLFLSHPHYPDMSIFTRDRCIIPLLEEHTSPELYQQLRRLRAEKSRRVVSVATFIAVLFCLGWGLSLAWSPTTHWLAGFIPFSWEQKVGKLLFGGLSSEMTFINDEQLNRKLLEVSKPLLDQVQGFTFELHIAKSDELNAFAIPGGIVVINSATILKAARPEELLGVLAHEISHVTERHTIRQAITVFGVYMIADLLLGDFFGSIAAISQGASYLLKQGFSRDQEHEADVQGFAYLEAARIDPNGMVDFFSRIREQREQNPSLATLEKSLSFLSTHPDTDLRIKDLQERITRRKDPLPAALPLTPFRELQDRLQILIREVPSDPDSSRAKE